MITDVCNARCSLVWYNPLRVQKVLYFDDIEHAKNHQKQLTKSGIESELTINTHRIDDMAK